MSRSWNVRPLHANATELTQISLSPRCRDLAAHGFDRSLRLVSSRREEEIEEAKAVP